ncbi:hypothetical protein COLO4_09792 [Corchorus olitorius]|uniref:Leucine-rich repeat-containing N-terminal plant-type domain-containing protein n=1 Tax=Corchorus olitorius TaxID=93759 RepID=A0A1R3KB56_9ROSI|nr:hypothetical protein COLO4_09792 [Corchorus olitorius]
MLRLLRAYQYHFLLLALFFLSSQANPSPSSSSTKQLCSEEEAAALIQFKSSFSIDSAEYCGGIKSYPKTESWKEGTDCCSWDGVTCDEIKGQVIGLDLSCSCLKGRISSNSTLFHLRHLRELNLALNDFNYSKMPSKFGGFESLVELNLSSTHFAGQVPSQLSYLSKLVSLDLSGNGNYDDDDLVLDNDTLERLVRNLTEMRQLHLDELNMSCVNPSALMNLSSSLSSLRLSFCDLRGNFPENIFLLPNLKYLDLGWNQNLNLKFPELINRSSPLQLLDLSKLSLSKDDSISSLQSLKDLNLIGTSFSGGRGFPASIMNLSSLEHLDANDAYFSGAFGGGLLPDSIGNLVSLKYLDLSNCNMSGPLPISLGNLSQLTKLSLSNNKFRGQIPSTLTNLTQLEELSLDHNQLEGSIPDDKVVAIGYGCGLVFGLAVGYVVFQTGKPKWFVTLVEEQQHRRRKKPKIGDRSGVRRIYKSVQKLGPW